MTCGHTNPAGYRFCGACGQALDLRACACGFVGAAEDRFCGRCGRDLQLAPTALAADSQGRGFDLGELAAEAAAELALKGSVPGSAPLHVSQQAIDELVASRRRKG